jgi:hypothetical protein
MLSVALLPVALLAALSGCGSDPATTAAAPAPATTPAEATTAPTTAPATTAPAAGAVCPAKAADLEKAQGFQDVYPSGWHLTKIHCAQRWATGTPTADDPAKQGDGIILFEYKSGAWTKLAEGSDLECTDYGIPASIVHEVGCGL